MKNNSGLGLIYRFVHEVFPKVDIQLDHWAFKAGCAGDEVLKAQALSSIAGKKFHAQGGSAYSLYPGTSLNNTVRFIVAFQTISDYLDNLCDRAGVYDETAFRQLHLAMLDAVDPNVSVSDYYLYYPHKDDAGYLRSLVEECREQVRKLPSFRLVEKPVKKFIKLYSELQTYKHLSTELREKRLESWAKPHLTEYPGISCWEFSAATGSTLGIFILVAAAHDPHLGENEVRTIENAYFPWICGLHILLDYYIDMNEDMTEGDLNFVSYYENQSACKDRLALFIKQALDKCMGLKYPEFHKTIIRGLLAMYLSDPKALIAGNSRLNSELVRCGKGRTAIYHLLCRLLRKMDKI